MRDLIVSARRVSVHSRRRFRLLALAACPVAATWLASTPAYGQRTFGFDFSDWQGDVKPATFSYIKNTLGWTFGYVRASRGGTTGTWNQNTEVGTGSYRYDDTRFVNNITRGTSAGILMGSYHFDRADVAGNTGTDEANHYMETGTENPAGTTPQYAGNFMRPGYLLPVFDLEAGSGLSQAALTTWSLDFIDRIYEKKGYYPIVYTSSSYNNDEVTAAVAYSSIATSPHTGPRTYQWLARPSGNLATGDPGAATNYPNPYGGWDPNFVTRTNSRDPAVKPWAFWQNGVQTIDQTPFGGTDFTLDKDAANGNMEFVKDFLVPALWTTGASGDWSTMSNWNSNNTKFNASNVAFGPQSRLPNSNDWVKFTDWSESAVSGASYTVTLSSGAQSIRKFTTQQPVNITGGSLSVGYIPGSGGKFDVPSEFANAVSLSGAGAYTAYSTQVNGGGGAFNLNGGTVTFNSINLASHSSNAGKVVFGGNPTLAPYGNAGTAIIRSTGSLAQAGTVALGPADRTLTITNGSAPIDVRIEPVITGAGRLIKAGTGGLQLTGTNTYTGGTTITGGTLRITKELNLGATPVSAHSNNIVLDGGTLQTGAAIASLSLSNPGSGYTSFPSVTIGGAGPDATAPSANVLAGISSIAVSNGGSGYVNQSSAPAFNTAGTFVDLVGGGGTGATAFATVSGGVVTGITIINPGTGYTSMPTVYISSTAISGVAGSGAAAAVSGITLQNIALNDPGFDYAAPSVNLTGGGGTGAIASIAASNAITLAANRGVQLTNNGGTFNQAAGSTLNINGVVSGVGFTKTGTGTLVLNGVNTYTGTTTVNAGTLTANGTSGLGATTGALAVNNPNTGAGTAVVLNLSTTAATTKGSLSGTIASPSSGTNAATINNGGHLFTINQTSPGTFAGVIAGSGGFTLGASSTSTLTLTGASTYTGGTTISGGALALQTGGSLPNSGAVNVNGGTLAIGTVTDLVGNVTLTSGSITGTTGTLQGASYNVQSGTISAKLGGFATLTKNTPGTVSLSGANTYSGGTFVNDGTLSLGASGVLADSANVTVGGGTLSIGANSETVSGVTLASGSITGTTGTLTGLSYAVQSGSISANLAGAAAMTKTTAGTVTLSGVNSYTGGTAVNGGTLVAGHHAAFGTDGLTVAAGATARMQAGLATAMSLSTVGTTGTGEFDLTDNSLVVKNSTLAAVQAQVKKGFNLGTWAGAGGINSSSAASNHLTAIGYASNGVLNLASFKGVTGLDADDVLVKYTYAGDANLDGKVDIGDLGLLAGAWQQLTDKVWYDGDFTYDGAVDIGDLGLLAGNWQMGTAGNPNSPLMTFNQALAQFSAFDGEAVPEPASAAVLAAAGLLGLVTRRRRQR